MTTASPALDHGHASPHADDHGHPRTFIGKYIFSRDHKVIGIQFLITVFFTLALGGLLALGVRWQLAYPWKPFPILGELLWPESGGVMPAEFYPMLTTMHASVMIFLVVIPALTGAFGNFVIPLQIGARDMAFPTMNMLSYWFMWPALAFFGMSFFVEGGAAASGWTSYAPLSTVSQAAPGSMAGQTYWLYGLLCVGISSLLGSINYITTIVKLRTKGMKFFRMPMTTWSLFITAILQAFALPVLTAALIFQVLDREMGTAFFLPTDLSINNESAGIGGGHPLLWQHMFWFYSHPAVYIMILPAMGVVSDILCTFARKPLFGYKPMVLAICGIAGLGFIVWGHHMFQSGMNPALGMTFMTSTMLIALPSAVKTFNWLGTLWGSKIQWTTPMLNALSFVSMFVIGGLSGLFMAATTVDIFIHDTYFIVAHIHYVLFGGSLFGFFGGLYYWFPKMFGRQMSEFWGKVHFLGSFIFFNLVFFPMHILGMGGFPRRYADPYWFDTWKETLGMNRMMTVCAIFLGLWQIILVLNFVLSLFMGRKTDGNPWRSNSLEWMTPKVTPGHGNWGEKTPEVFRGPFEYGAPGCEDDGYLPQTAPPVSASESHG
ncbi:MAG: cytochrome c oxidase subunit I [Planctomycetota bacterium]|nr:MAG: cytochrome c oxidase subunit I [Planctomycetota bacterium]